MRRRFRLALAQFLALPLLVLVGISLSGCLRHGSPNVPSREPRWLRWSLANAPTSARLAALTGAGLVRLRADATPEPLLAQSWEWVTPRQLVFHLRPNSRWSDGTAIVATDFLPARAPFTQLILRAPNPHTLIVQAQPGQIDEPRASWIAAFAHPALWPRHGDLTSGPFLAAKSQRGALRFTRNPFYPQPASYEGVELSWDASAENRLARFHEREFDLVDDLEGAVSARLNGAPSRQQARGAYRWVLAFNAGRRPFSEHALREIFAASIAREETAPLLGWHDFVAAGFGWLDPSASSRRGPAYNPSQAKKSFDDLGADLRASKWSLTWDDRADARELAENLQAQWQKNLGVTVELAPSEPTAGLQLIALDNDVLQPGNTLSRFALGRAPGGWRSPRLDEILQQVSHAADQTQIERAIERGERHLADETAVVIPLIDKGRAVLRNARVRDLEQNPFGDWDFARANLD